MNLSDDPTLSQAVEQLSAMEAEEAKNAPAAQPESTLDSATTGERAPETDEAKGSSTQTNSTDGAPATDDQQKPAEQQKEPEPKPDAKAETKYSKAAKEDERKKLTWKQVNAEKDAVRAEAEKLKAEREAIAKERAEIEAAKAKSTNTQGPEYYEDGAKKLAAQAEKLEASGDFDAADEKRALSRQAARYAAELRANPPATTEQKVQAQKDAEAKFESDRKEWWGKAYIDFPEAGKADSPVALKLKAMMTKGDPAYDPEVAHTINTTPKGLYYAARLVSAETSAARVPGLEKELGELRAKVKEFATKNGISTESAVLNQSEKPYAQMSEQEQEEQLRRELSGEQPSWL